MIWYDLIWFDIIRYYLLIFDIIWYDLLWFDITRYDLICKTIDKDDRIRLGYLGTGDQLGGGQCALGSRTDDSILSGLIGAVGRHALRLEDESGRRVGHRLGQSQQNVLHLPIDSVFLAQVRQDGVWCVSHPTRRRQQVLSRLLQTINISYANSFKQLCACSRNWLRIQRWTLISKYWSSMINFWPFKPKFW